MSSSEKAIIKALELKKQGQFEKAEALLESLAAINEDPKIKSQAYLEAAKIDFYETKKFEKAIELYRKVVLFSPDPQTRMSAQKDLITILFHHLNQYPESIKEINKLLPLLNDPVQKSEMRLSLARAHYYINNFNQADMETEEILKTESGDRFQALILRGNIALAKKNIKRATELFALAYKENPEQAIKEKTAVSLAIAYEEQKDFKQAVEILEKIKKQDPNPEFIQIRINRLIERMKQQPGARGMKK